VVDGPVPAEFHNFEDFAADLDSGKLAVASKREQTSFFVDDHTVRTITPLPIPVPGWVAADPD